MADETATFAVDLKDGTSGPAEAAAKALANLKSKIDADTTALGQMQKALRNLKGAAQPNTEQITALSKRIAEQRQSIASAQSSYLSLGGSFDKSKGGARSFAQRMAELGKTTEAMPGPVSGLVGRLSALRGLVAGGALVAGIAAVAAALVAVAAAAVAATAALLKYGLASANARRAEFLQLEGLTKVRNWYGVAAGKASDMQAAIDRVAGSTALGRDKIVEYARSLYQMHMRGKNLDLALEAMAIKGAAVGDEGARAFAGWAAGANLAGHSVKALADDVKARFGAVAAAQLLDLNVQTAKLRENFSALFAGLRIEGLLKAISVVTSLFSQSTRSGQALRSLVEKLLQPLINAAEYAAPIVKRFFQGITIAALVTGIAILRVRNWIRETFGASSWIDRTHLMRAALLAGAAAVGVLLLALAPAVLIFGAFGLVVYRVVQAFSLIGTGIGKAYDAIAGIEWRKLGGSIVEGIVNGITGKARWLLDTISDLGTNALDALSKRLGIASPSRVFARLGIEIPRGIASGVEAGKPTARAAVGELVDVPRLAPAAAGGAEARTPRAASSTITIDVGGIQITTSAAAGSEIAADVERELVPVFERIALQLGARLPGVPA